MNLDFWLGVILFGIFLYWQRRNIHHYFNRTVSVCALSVVVAAVLVTAFLGRWLIVGKTELQSVFYALETVFSLLEGDSGEFRRIFEPCGPLRLWSCLLSVLLPVLTAGTVLILLADHLPRPVVSAKVYYVFSHLDHRTLLLAENIANQKTQEKCGFFFLRTEQEEIGNELKNRLHRLHCRCFPYAEAELLRYHPRLRHKKLRFFFLSENTDENFQQMQDLLKSVEARHLFQESDWNTVYTHTQDAKNAVYQQELYLLSETVSAPMLIDSLRAMLCENSDITEPRKEIFRWTELRLLDRYRSLSYELLKEIPLYQTARNGRNSVLILGLGRVGESVFRTIVSFSSMVGHEISFTICDRDIEEHYSAMKQRYPECADGYSVQKIDANVEACDLTEKLEQSDGFPYTLIVICLGDDERNINVASQLKRIYRKQHWNHSDDIQPYICVNVEDQIKSDYTKKLFADGGCENWNHPLIPFGTDRDRFSVRTLMPRKVWTAAQDLHSLMKKTQAWQLGCWSEYERRSSIACVCHMAYHVESIKDPEYPGYHYAAHESGLIEAEHRRWMDYVRTEGMQAVSMNIVDAYYDELQNYVDVAGQLTPCLVPAEELDMLYRRLRASHQIGDQMPTFREKDRIVVENAAKLTKISEVDSSPNGAPKNL